MKKTTSTRNNLSPLADSALLILALGANLPSSFGDPEVTLAWAVSRLAARLSAPALSSLFESEPLDGTQQPLYLNSVLVGRTTDPPETWLELGQLLEQRAGRQPGPRWGPRPLDVDLIALGLETRDAARLTLPHPELANRRFVLAPLAELLPDLILPGYSAPIVDLLDQSPRTPAVVRRSWRQDPLA